ncbi:hypothetical protein CEK60_01490 [Halomonas sp. N3-2A]|nr:hypothetical protein CEK60_01490 [Halomonas sp. N3-2A]
MLFGIIILAFSYLLILFVLQVERSGFYLEIISGMNATSISIFVAVFLFLVKEVLEYRRKRKARLRKIGALKAIISEEIELNHWTWLKIKDLIETVKSEPSDTLYKIIKSTSGTEKFEYYNKDGGGGQSFPKVYEHLIDKHLTEIAELNENFYIAAINYTKALAELSHLRAGAYDFIHETPQGRHYVEGFVSYASDQLPKIFTDMEKCYQICSGEELYKHRMR